MSHRRGPMPRERLEGGSGQTPQHHSTYMTSRPSQRARSSISAATASRGLVGQRLVLVDRVDAQHALGGIGGGVELPDQPVAVEDRQRVVAPDPLLDGLVHLEQVVELEELVEPLAVLDQPVERREQRGAARERRVEERRLDPPLALHALDDRGLADVADVVRLALLRRLPHPGHAERVQPPLVAHPQRLVGVGHRVVGVDPLGEVPQRLAALATGRGHLAAGDHLLEQHLDVLVVVPARRRPGHLAAVLERARRQRPLPPSSSRISRRQPSLVSTHAAMSRCHSLSGSRPGQIAISARNSAMSSLGRR